VEECRSRPEPSRSAWAARADKGDAATILFAVSPQEPPNTLLIELPQREDAQEVSYALRLRGIPSTIERVFRSPIKPTFEVRVHAADADRATEALPRVLDAMLPRRADDGAGNCYFCGFSLLGTSAYFENCPECGRELLSVEARLAARDGKRLREKRTDP
jgi:hypothetical protein